MTRQLLILRHAKSDWETSALTDYDRPLASRGKRDAPRIGAWLRRQGLVPDHIVSSPAKRARQTAKRVAKVVGLPKESIAWDDDVYAASAGNLLGALSRCPGKAHRVLLVGHNPGLEDLLRYLCGNSVQTPPDGKLLPTAALAHLEMPKDWRHLAPGCAKLLVLTRPTDLPE